MGLDEDEIKKLTYLKYHKEAAILDKTHPHYLFAYKPFTKNR
jgi:hypothetical protein